MQEHFYGVIMAGGVGSRFWPMSTSAHPKQFIDILGTGKSLLQQTFSRLSKICPENQIYIVTNQRYKKLCLQQLPGIASEQILCEPARRNTAPCIAYAYQKIGGKDPNAVMIVAPSDHLITDEVTFIDVVTKSMNYAFEKDVLLTIGIKPSRPDTGYGYINYDKTQNGFVKVKSFTEKPDLEKAKSFLESGDYSWNSGMFIWTKKSIDNAFKTHLPKIQETFEQGKELLNGPSEQKFIDEVYPNCENISIDYGIMERASNAEVVNADFGWSDLGTWGSLYDHIPMDASKNAIVGQNVMTFNSKGNLVQSSEGKLVVIQGLDDFIVVDHENTLLICKKEEEQNIKKIVERIEKEKGSDFV